MILKQLADELFGEKQNEIRQIIREELDKFFTVHLQNQKLPYLLTKEACALLRCKTTKLRYTCIEHGIVPTKIGGVNYYLRTDIDKIFQKD